MNTQTSAGARPDLQPVAERASDRSAADAGYYGHPNPGASAEGFPGSLNPVRLLNLLTRRWFTILLVVLFVGCAAAYYLKHATRLYRSRATIELSTRRPRILNQQAAVIEDPASVLQFEETLNTQLEKFRSKGMLASVLACYRQQNPDDRTPDDVLGANLGAGVSFSLIRRTRLVAVDFISSDAEFATRACQAFAEGAEADARAENRIASDAAVAWLEAQARTQKLELEKADQALFDGRQRFRIDLLEGERKTVQQAMLSFNEALVGVESQIAMERELLDALTAADLRPELAGKLPASVARAKDVESALERWQLAVTERDALLARYTPEHPEVKARDQAVRLLRDQAAAALERARSAAAANLALLKNQAESLRRSKEEQGARASEIERDLLDHEMKLASLQRSRAASDASYQGVLNRIQEARLSADENTATVKLIDRASPPGGPVSPNVIRILLLAIGLGLAGGVGLAIAIEVLEDPVASTHDLESIPGLRVLAVVPHVRRCVRTQIARAAAGPRFGGVVEAYAGLRSMLDAPSYRDHSRVVLVASALPEEGKTTTCCNFATSCARNGQRVLLIDFDLRRPRIAGIFPMPDDRKGLQEYLSGGGVGRYELPYAADCPNLTIIACRPDRRASPAELVGGPQAADLVAWARANFDRVVLDAPPLGLVSDALVLAGLADCVLISARPSVSRKRAVADIVARFRDVGVRHIAAVLNDVDVSKSSYHGYGPYYHYHKQHDSYRSTPPDAGGECPQVPAIAGKPGVSA